MDAKTLCLAVLSRGDASGYEIKKKLEEAPFSHFQDTGFGSIYPALGALSKDGLVTGRAMPQEKRPDKKVYSITPAGRTTLIEALQHPPGPDKFRSDFLFILFLADHASPEHLRRIIDDRTGTRKRAPPRAREPLKKTALCRDFRITFGAGQSLANRVE